jgi:hypothetical protein
MGRKSSAKAQTRATTATPNPPDEPRRFSPLLVVALCVLAVAIVGAVSYVAIGRRGTDGTQAANQPDAPPGATPAAAPVREVPEVSRKAYPDAKTPPLPYDPMPPARPMEVVRAAYKFAAEHPDVLSYVPCYCGCERSGHQGNTDCFVTSRAENGDVIAWEPHGMT